MYKFPWDEETKEKPNSWYCKCKKDKVGKNKILCVECYRKRNIEIISKTLEIISAPDEIKIFFKEYITFNNKLLQYKNEIEKAAGDASGLLDHFGQKLHKLKEVLYVDSVYDYHDDDDE